METRGNFAREEMGGPVGPTKEHTSLRKYKDA